MDNQHEALRLADLLERMPLGRCDEQAAAELRRLHAVNQELLEASRVAVLALAHANETAPGLYDDAYDRVSAAITKAEGEKT